MLPSFDPSDTKSGLALLEELTLNASRIQREVLEEILTQNARTDYLRQYMDGHVDKELFKEKVPVVDYDDVKPYIERIANGDRFDIISAQPISELLTSSGTSGGKPKMMPSTEKELERKTFFYNLLEPIINNCVDGLDQGKAMYLLFVKPEISTPCSLPARPVLTSYYKSIHFRNRPHNRYNVYTSPDETILCEDSTQSMYCQLLCGLIQRDEILRVGAIFASAFLRAIKFLENNWRELCLNIRTGRLSDWIVDSECRDAVLKILEKPDPALARSIERECGNSSWEGIIRKLWPKTKYVEVIVTGSMAQYIPILEIYSGGLPLVSTMYASSECYFGINFKPLSDPSDVSYTLIPNMAFFEFLPAEKGHEETDHKVRCNCTHDRASSNENDRDDRQIPEAVVDLVDVKVGNYYELIVTTFNGLYRYRVGDILMVTGFHNSAPQFRFVQRQNVILSIDAEKTSEEDLLNAVTGAKRLLEPLGYILTEYTSYADTSSVPGHYVLFWEIKVNDRTGAHDGAELCNRMEECCKRVEESLDYVYRRCRRKDGSIGALEIRVVKEGTFDALMDYCLWQGSSVNQYKTPRCIKSEAAVEILESCVVDKFFSRELPNWEPYNMSSPSSSSK